MNDMRNDKRNPKHVARRRIPLRALVGTAAAMTAAVVIAVGVSAGSLAMWADNSGVTAGTVQSGSIGLTAASSFTATNWSNMLVGESVRQPFTLTNTGTVDLWLTATATSTTGFEIRVASGACGAQLTGTAASAAPTTLTTLAAGATATVCLEVALVSGAAPASQSAFVVTVTGDQVHL